MTSDNTSFINLKLSVQRALLGYITPNIRCIAVSINEKNICLFFYFDGMVTESDRENVSCIESEVIADFEEGFDIYSKIENKNYPEPIKIESGVCVYFRKETY